MDQKTQLDWLEFFPALALLNDSIWLETLQEIKVVNIPNDTIIFRQGDLSDKLYFLVEGSARTFINSDNGREMAVTRLRGGDMCMFTLSASLLDEVYSASGITETASRVACMNKSDFLRAYRQSEGFQDYILTALAGKQHELLFLLHTITFQHLDKRLAKFLNLYTLNKQKSSIHLTHQQIANELGTTREMISRILKEFEQSGYIQLKRRNIEILVEQIKV